ncbi:MAG TPA: thiamine diphosphokinase [Cryptosporangiaceae bacterium]|nr:thiamine diphosphokinase [Cryptosporangiaceae bacterium]
MTDTVVVVTGGEPVLPGALAGLPADAYVVAADGGIAHALGLGLRVDEAVGDFDSATPGQIDAVARAGGRIVRHPVAKDATDLELALGVALAARPARIVVLGGHGGRFDHWLANGLLLAAPAYAGVRLQARMGVATLTVVRRPTVLRGEPGELVSLLPVHGTAFAVRTDGLRYPLCAEDLPAGTSRGVSNAFLGTEATVSLAAGVLLAVQPGVP